jgi:uncharacterized membrane protein
MSDSPPVADTPGTVDPHEKNLALIAYVLHLLGAFTLLSSIAALVINYIKRDESSTVLSTHHRWMIRTFWWGLVWCLLALVLAFVLIGFLVYGVVAVWWIYRHVRGLLALAENKPLPV